ncbi:MAG: ABC transporter permease [Treponema sp. CETP13]|nr:MAG: ABC transporter permease [Treponema sp. CETP13]
MHKNNTSLKKQTFSEYLLSSNAAISVIVVLLGFLVGTLIVLLVGKNPGNMYKSFLQAVTGISQKRNGSWNWNIRYVGEWLNTSVPFILCGLCMAFAARAGLFNIGGEGQYIVGMTVAQVIALLGPQVSVFHWVLAIVCAIICGAVWGGIVGFLKAKFEVSEVVATIMLNYVALYLSRIVIMAIPGTNTYKTVDFPVTASIRVGWLSKITNGSMLNLGFFMALIAVFLYWFIMNKTNLGFGLRATGFNRNAAKSSGMPVVVSLVLAMAISGAFAGLAGGCVALGSFRYGRVISGMDNYGFTGIAVALVGNNTAVGNLLAGLLFGMLQTSQPIMQSKGLPKEITLIIQGLIVVFIALREGLKIYLRWQAKKTQERAISKTEKVALKINNTEGK